MKPLQLCSIFFLICLTTVSPEISAETFNSKVGFTYFFDNMEFGDGRRYTGFDKAGTIHAIRLTPEVGFKITDKKNISHEIMAGVDLMRETGSGSDVEDILHEAIIYYTTDVELSDGASFTAVAGIFPRDMARMKYNPLFEDEKVLFYDNNLEGFYLCYENDDLYVDAGLDWMGQYGGSGDSHRRERFQILSKGRWLFLDEFALSWMARYYHYACAPSVAGVVDNDLLNPMVEWIPSTSLGDICVGIGWVCSYQADRLADDIQMPGGFVASQRFEKNNIGLDNHFFVGDDMMPYFDKFGTDFYFGEECYHSGISGISWCDQLSLYWAPEIIDWMDLVVSCSFHLGQSINGSPLFRGWQQTVSLRLDID